MIPDLQAGWPIPAGIAPEALAHIQSEFSRDWLNIIDLARQGQLRSPSDRRFSSPEWASSPGHLLTAHAYLLSARAMQQMVDAVSLPDALREKLRFSVMQWIEAISPSNFLATNPEVQKRLIDTEGASLRQGMQNLLADIQKGRMSQTDESKFQLGGNVGITPGAVVFENRLIQLIQYQPQTATVHKRPLLIVPPCINKFYILDLQPSNSFVRHALEQGFSVFLVSWRNPVPSDTDGIEKATWDDYLDEGVLEAVRVLREISGQSKINALGFCVGGTLLASALALAQARGEQPVEALTLLTTLLDFSDTGVLDVFVDEAHVQTRERQLANGGLMTARELGTTFSFLRPAELVWNYVVGNYLKGEAPPAFDLLYWNADGTNLPGPFFAWYLRNAYLQNNLRKPGGTSARGHALDLSVLSMPTYVYGSRDDHIVPWKSAYASTGILRGRMRFVLGSSGHIAGVVNPPAASRRHYWVCDDVAAEAMPRDPQAWLSAAGRHEGSWWPDWSRWLAAHSGRRVRSGTRLGSADYPPLEPAPGRFVQVRAV